MIDPIRNPELFSLEQVRRSTNGWRVGSTVRSEETGEINPRYSVHIRAETDQHADQDHLFCKLYNIRLKSYEGRNLRIIDLEQNPPMPLRNRILYITDHALAPRFPYLRRDPQNHDPIAITYRRMVLNVFVALPPQVANQDLQPLPVPQFALMAGPDDDNAVAVEYLPRVYHLNELTPTERARTEELNEANAIAINARDDLDPAQKEQIIRNLENKINQVAMERRFYKEPVNVSIRGMNINVAPKETLCEAMLNGGAYGIGAMAGATAFALNPPLTAALTGAGIVVTKAAEPGNIISDCLEFIGLGCLVCKK